MPRLFIIGLIFGCMLASGAQSPDEDLAKELPRIKPTEAVDAAMTFKLKAGFTLHQAAAEPLVTDPVSACYDEDGRLYVVEMRGYPYPEKVPSGNVRRLEDTDGDGTFDKSVIFYDGLSWPTSVVPYDGGVFIAVPPEILYAKDTDGDGVADIKKVAFRGFGVQNVQALVNGLIWGPDGWIYGASGGNGGEIENLLLPGSKVVSVRGRDFRFRPDGSVFETISGGGQFGHSFDDWGHRFVTSNSNHIRQIILPSAYLDRNPALSVSAVLNDIAVEGGAGPVFRISPVEPWRLVRTRQRAADPAYRNRLPPSELVPAGFFTSATGVTIYRGSAYPAEYRGNAFIGDVGGNLVHRKTLAVAGSHYMATRADQGVEFLASTDNWFRPVNFVNTPDGTLLILDMYRETIEHPASIPEPIKKHLDLTSGHDRGRLYELLPETAIKRRTPRLSTETTAHLVELLADPDSWWRETAQRLLIERKDLGALPLLHQMVQVRPTALGRLHALWTLSILGDLKAADVHEGMNDREPRVIEASSKLGEMFVDDEHVYDDIISAASERDPMIRFQAAFSLGAVNDPNSLGALLRIAVRDRDDPWTRAAVESSLRGRAGQFARVMAEQGTLVDTVGGRALLADLATLVGVENKPQEVAELLGRFAGEDADPARARAVLVGLGKGLQRSGGSLRKVLNGPLADSISPLFAKATTTAQGEGSVEDRSEAIRLVGMGPLANSLEVLPELLDARQPSEIQLAALQALAEVPSSEVGPRVTARFASLSPTSRREAAEILFARPDRIVALLDAIEAKSIAPNDLDLARRTSLTTHPDPTIQARAKSIFGATSTTRAQVLAQFQTASKLTGDPAKGQLVFRKVCATCHRAEGVGIDIGPNLATVAGRTPEDLLIHILDPNREVAPQYVNYNVALTDGRVLSGVIAEEGAGSITLKRAEGASDVLPRARIEAIKSTGLSLMPEGLEANLKPEDLADVIAYVRSIQAGGQTGGR